MNIRENILNFLFPKFCLFCGKEKSYLCAKCFSKIAIFSSPFCPYCKLRSPDGKICGKCKKSLTVFISASPYSDDNIRKIIETFKYKFVKELANPLALLLLKFIHQNPEIEFFKNPLDFLILPIPLHKRKQRERGFNQAEEIGKEISPLLKIPIRTDILFRKKYTSSQTKIKDRKEKEKNVKNVFKVRNPEEIKNKKIILLDDVSTSSATMESAAKSLKEKGIKEIWGLTIAKG